MSTEWGDIPGGLFNIDKNLDNDWRADQLNDLNARDAYEQKIMSDLANHTSQQQFQSMYQGAFSDDRNVDPRYRYEQEIHKLRERLHELEAEKNIELKEKLAELSLRCSHPSVQEAWEQYQIVIKLVQE